MSRLHPSHFLAENSRCGDRDGLTDSLVGAFDSSGSPRELLAGLSRVMPKTSYTPASENRPDTSTLAAADFDVDVRSGFLPPDPPLERVDGPSYDVQNESFQDAEPSIWESMLDWSRSIPLTLGGQCANYDHSSEIRRWRKAIRNMPIVTLSDRQLDQIKFARRACLVLAFLSHWYMHAQPDVGQYESDASKATAITRANFQETKWYSAIWSRRDLISVDEHEQYDALLPSSLAVPLLALSEKLGLPPVLTYATTVLWNWTLKDPSAGLVASNMRIKETFTNTQSEAHFYLISLLIELQGVEALTLMRISLNEAFAVDELAEKRIACYLEELTQIIYKLKDLVRNMRDGCDPSEFYWKIRPWFRAGDAMFTNQGSRRVPGWILEGTGAERSVWTGPSAGQSSLIHALDLFLDVDHARVKRPRDSSEIEASTDVTFMERMQMYMPLYHRAFLQHLQNGIASDSVTAPNGNSTNAEKSNHPIRSLVLRCSWAGVDHPLVLAYNDALRALRSLRDEHMRIAMEYIVKPARARPPTELNQTTAEKPLYRGTGGTELVGFLRDCRKNTTDTIIEHKRHM